MHAPQSLMGSSALARLNDFALLHYFTLMMLAQHFARCKIDDGGAGMKRRERRLRAGHAEASAASYFQARRGGRSTGA